MRCVRIATWNVNSVKQRLPRLLPWLDERRPDVLCLQETKLADAAFPALAFQGLGYDAAHHGEGRWNGVAILSRVGLEDVVAGFSDQAEEETVEARLLSATCAGVRVSSVYVPNGRAVGSQHYQDKLAWLERIGRHLRATCDPDGEVVVCGDFNVAPDDRDVWDPKAFAGATHVSLAERQALAALIDWGLVDVFRQIYPEDRVYSWWDYRAGGFRRNEGLRIDHVWVSGPLAERCARAWIDKEPRGWERPSDHTPVVAEFK